ncbi:putative helicase [Megavirus courdo11]|uniref:D5-ATPase-helicase n=2 Tax=Megavirus TaxID=3044761 RepID=H6WBI5_9VIRU|nr:D5-ATPase-helicase [Megavirus montpellier]AEY99299.1 D5-ATPase-helicase [Megavirus courdo11]AFX92340.1 putative helicase [Megavirus courdo11]
MVSKSENKPPVNSKSLKTKSSQNIKKTNKSQKQNKHENKPIQNENELQKLQLFMSKYAIKNDAKTPYCTHTTMQYPYGKFIIPEDMYSKFTKLYEDVIVAGYEPGVVERHKNYGPIVIDLDFDQPKDKTSRYYTEVTIRNVVKLYNRIIKKYLDVNSSNLFSYVSEKKQLTKASDKMKDGFHIVYPYICTKPALQQLMRHDFIELAKKYNIFKTIPHTNNIESIMDESVIYRNGWMMYGSKKNSYSHVYYVTHIYQSISGKLYDHKLPGSDDNSRSTIRHYINALSCRRFFSEESITPLADDIDPMEIDKKIEKLTLKIKKNVHSNVKISDIMGEDTAFVKAVPENILVEARNLVKLFSKERATDYHGWYQVGKCLHNIDYRLLTDWIEFSKKCPSKYKTGECEKLWRSMRPSNYTMATLHYFASKDNPKQYIKMKEEKISELVKSGLEASHNTIAKLLMEKYKFIYKCASIKHNTWYEFKNHRWIEIDSAYTLRNLISDELTKEYADRQRSLYAKQAQKEGYEKEKCMNEATHISKVIKQLNNSTFKNGVIRECADIAYDPNFLKNLDENIYLICFENGVYDLDSDVFRDGCPDDYISLCTNYKYVKLDENDGIIMEIREFLQKIQPEKEMRDYVMTLLSTCLAGSISDESFYVFTGSGANGKSKLLELLKYTLGDLFKPMDIRMLTEKRSSSSSASPELADKKGIRACPFDEPKATDEINTGFMKIFTGGDTITARALFKEPIYFKPQFKPFLLCNDLPNIKSDDDGTWRRLKVIPFLSKFVKMAEATKKMRKEGLPENHYWADNNLSEKLPEWKQGFMCLLIGYYKNYKTNMLVHPKLVTKYTADYRKKCDVFQDFISDYLERTENPKNTVKVLDMHEGMRSWYRANYDGKCPGAKELRNYMNHKMPTYNKKTDSLTHYRFKTDDDEEDDVMNNLDDIKA